MATLLALCAFGGTYWRGVDASFIPEYRDLKTKFFVGTIERDPLKIFADEGSNLLRLRVWVNPPKGYCDLSHTLRLAKEANALGMKILLNFHYSDDWADPQHQVVPDAWKSFDLARLAKATEDHSYEVTKALVDQGTPPVMIQVGNEIRLGMEWPLGKLTSDKSFDPLATLLRAGVSGVEKAMPKKSLYQIMIHHDQGGSLFECLKFYAELERRNVRFDVIGLSFYPWWHGKLTDLESTLNGLSMTFKKDVMVVETAYPFTREGADRTGNFVWEKSVLNCEYPATTNGQVSFLKRLHKIVRGVPDGRGVGVVYWAPEYVARPGIQTPCENLALFDFGHRVLPGLAALCEKGK